MRSERRRVVIALAISLVLILSGEAARAQQRETVDVESRFRGKPLMLSVQVFLPDKRGDDKVPVMIVSHGSAGVRAVHELAYAHQFLAMGVAVAIVDSFSARGLTSTVRDQSPVTSYEMLVDVVSTLKVIARHPAIDPARIGVIGFSKGGTVVVKAALQRYMKPLAETGAGFALLIALYPWCGDQPLDFNPANGAPLHMLLGAEDRYVGVEGCREFGEKFAAHGGNLDLKVYPGAQHGWDVPGNTNWRDPAGQNSSKCVYDEITPGTWVERGSQIKIVQDNKPTGNFRKASAGCMTLGVSGGYNVQVHAQSLPAVLGYIREAFRLP